MAFRVGGFWPLPNKPQRIAKKTATSGGGLFVFKQAYWSDAGYWHFRTRIEIDLSPVMRFKAGIGQVLPMGFDYTHVLI